MKGIKTLPEVFSWLLSQACICETDIVNTDDDFFAICKSLSDILETKRIIDFPDSKGDRMACNRFFDDWYLYAVPSERDYVYSLFKLREQEHDAEEGVPADGDTPGVTISFISFLPEILLRCIEDPTDDNRRKISNEINRVVAWRGQRHHEILKTYFLDPKSKGSYLVADLYVKHIASFAENGCIDVPEHYSEIVQKSMSHKNTAKLTRLPRFIDMLNERAGAEVCDHKKIYITDKNNLNEFERLAILATHTGNVSVHSFAAEVEYHAKFLIPIAKMRIPFFGKSIYASAIRADMTIDDAEFEGPAPFYRLDSKLVKRQQKLHCECNVFEKGACGQGYKS